MSGEAKCGGLIRGVRRYGWTTVGVIATLFISLIFNGILYLVSITVWKVTDKQNRHVEVRYVGTHENADYDEYVEIHLRGIPSDRAELVKEAIEKILDLAEISFQKMEKDDAKSYSIEEVFPDFHIGTALRGLRSREGLTQKQLGKMIGAKPSHISEMENGKRTIGKEMAKRLAKALRTNYKIFL